MSALLWIIILIIRRQHLSIKDFKRYLKGTIINLLFLVYATILKVSILMFACTEIEGTWYLDVYMHDECWAGDHWTYTTAVAIPSLLIWVIGLPCLAFYKLFKANE